MRRKGIKPRNIRDLHLAEEWNTGGEQTPVIQRQKIICKTA